MPCENISLYFNGLRVYGRALASTQPAGVAGICHPAVGLWGERYAVGSMS